jgi:hypothetical protein
MSFLHSSFGFFVFLKNLHEFRCRNVIFYFCYSGIKCIFLFVVFLLSLIKIFIYRRGKFFVNTSAHLFLCVFLIFSQSRHSFFFQEFDKYSFLFSYSLFMLWFNKNNSLICLEFVSVHNIQGSFTMANQLSQCSLFNNLIFLLYHILNIHMYWYII